MKELRHYPNNQLTKEVFTDKYFTVELKDTEFVIALVKEEFYYSWYQYQHLLNSIALYKLGIMPKFEV
jgi:hypothetical protein